MATDTTRRGWLEDTNISETTDGLNDRTDDALRASTDDARQGRADADSRTRAALPNVVDKARGAVDRLLGRNDVS